MTGTEGAGAAGAEDALFKVGDAGAGLPSETGALKAGPFGGGGRLGVGAGTETDATGDEVFGFCTRETTGSCCDGLAGAVGRWTEVDAIAAGLPESRGVPACGTDTLASVVTSLCILSFGEAPLALSGVVGVAGFGSLITKIVLSANLLLEAQVPIVVLRSACLCSGTMFRA